MNSSDLTRHARERMQQRSIPPLVLDLLDECGTRLHSCGAERIIFDKAACKRLKRKLGGDRGMRFVEPWLKVYAILGDDGRYVTASHTRRRIWRD